MVRRRGGDGTNESSFDTQVISCTKACLDRLERCAQADIISRFFSAGSSPVKIRCCKHPSVSRVIIANLWQSLQACARGFVEKHQTQLQAMRA